MWLGYLIQSFDFLTTSPDFKYFAVAALSSLKVPFNDMIYTLICQFLFYDDSFPGAIYYAAACEETFVALFHVH